MIPPELSNTAEPAAGGFRQHQRQLDLPPPITDGIARRFGLQRLKCFTCRREAVPARDGTPRVAFPLSRFHDKYSARSRQ